jgi:hypothetical protein
MGAIQAAIPRPTTSMPATTLGVAPSCCGSVEEFAVPPRGRSAAHPGQEQAERGLPLNDSMRDSNRQSTPAATDIGREPRSGRDPPPRQAAGQQAGDERAGAGTIEGPVSSPGQAGLEGGGNAAFAHGQALRIRDGQHEARRAPAPCVHRVAPIPACYPHLASYGRQNSATVKIA